MIRFRIAAALLLGLVLLASTAVALFSWHNYDAQDRASLLSDASAHHPLGTDDLGRDRLTRLALAALLSLSLSAIAAAFSTTLAALIGLAIAASTGAVRSALLLACDLLIALPWIFLIMMVRGALPLSASPLISTFTTYLLLALMGWPACARVVYRGTSVLLHAPWMAQLHAQGTTRGRLLFRHLLPNLRPMLLAQFLITLPAFLIAEVDLGVLGLGTPEPLPSWGAMLRDLQNYSAWTGNRLQLAPLLVLTLVIGSLQLCTADAFA